LHILLSKQTKIEKKFFFYLKLRVVVIVLPNYMNNKKWTEQILKSGTSIGSQDCNIKLIHEFQILT
jgi:hypothetical protein